MRFSQQLITGRLLRRYKRFLVDVELGDGSVVTAHCPNTGALLGCRESGMPVWLSVSDNPARKYQYTWELVEIAPRVRVGINTGRSNALVHEALKRGLIPEFRGYGDIRREVSVNRGSSRIDFLLTGRRRQPRYVEVKNVTAAVEAGVALFPDAVSERAVRHLDELRRLRSRGNQATVLFCVQREDVHTVRPAEEIDPAYAAALRRAASKGVRLLAYRARVTPREIVLHQRISCRL